MLTRFRGVADDPSVVRGPALTDDDFAVLARHHDGKSWTAIPPDDQTALRDLRKRLGKVATLLAERLGGLVPLQAFTSNLNPSGRAPKFYWICAYPKASRNKSYAYQLFVIVHPEWVEVGCGSGDSQLQDAGLEDELRAEMALARASLAAAKGAPWTAELERRAHELRPRVPAALAGTRRPAPRRDWRLARSVRRAGRVGVAIRLARGGRLARPRVRGSAARAARALAGGGARRPGRDPAGPDRQHRLLGWGAWSPPGSL